MKFEVLKMPRAARIKSFDSIYHVMVRSISDVSLYREDTDKDKYLSLVKRYQDTYGYKIYAYCLMTTHGHLIIDANGADISKIMHGINQCYAQYFNRKYKRHGHVFQDRFKSKVVNDERYLVNLSAYIHNNPVDIEEYCNSIEKYEYSTLGIYLGIRKDKFKITNEDFIMQLFSNNSENARKRYLEFVYKCSNEALIEDIEFNIEKTEYRSYRTILARDYTPEEIIELITEYTGVEKDKIHAKYRKNLTESKALCVFFMRCFCNFSHKDICKVIGNLTQSRVSKLCSIGLETIYSSQRHKNIIEMFLDKKSA
jgi:putative transposase